MTFTMPRFTASARCAEADPEAFFPKKGHSAAPAKRICNGDADRAPCPARDECLAWALTHFEQGIWGGLSERQRKRLTGHRPQCGTPAGYRRHKARREAICDLCRQANADACQDYRAKRRAS